jgi:hypothetical protein
MSSKTNKKEDSTVLTEILNLKDGLSEDKTLSSDPQNNKVQQKFDSALNDLFDNSEPDIDFLATSEDSKPDISSQKTSSKIENQLDLDAPILEFEMSGTSDISNIIENSQNASEEIDNSISLGDATDDFGLDLGTDDNALDLSGIPDNFDESTKKTEVTNLKDLDFMSDELEFDGPKSSTASSSSVDLISSEEAKVNIEATIKDIVAPKKEKNTEFDPTSLEATSDDVLNNLMSEEEGGIDFNTSSGADISFGGVSSDKVETSFDNSLDDEILINQAVNAEIDEKTGSHTNSAIANKMNDDEDEDDLLFNKPATKQQIDDVSPRSQISDDEYVRLQTTIRQLREEREDFVSNIKALKNDVRELEQDNLTLKAALDETKIEISILRKRHLTEIEDYKYKFNLAEEKRAYSEEKLRNFEKTKEKLEQKSRIDIGQVRQREKELESKIELMAMDIDSQVTSREQKILELRRKIDSLEFNMENASIREQKSVDDKRKLEDKLNKIMKTLRNSIKNLEDDIEESADEVVRTEKMK